MQRYMLTGSEVQAMLCGQVEIDVEKWRAQTKRETMESVDEEQACQLVGWFWRIVAEFSQEQRQLLLKFSTGMWHMPLDGFSSTGAGHYELIIVSGSDPNRLPRAATCFNQLFLPAYTSKEALRAKLTEALEMAAKGGFELA